MKSRLKIAHAKAPINLAVCTLCAALGPFAQDTAATVQGTVSSGPRAAVPEAVVFGARLNTAVTNIASTTSQSIGLLADIAAGEYITRVSKSGFSNLRRGIAPGAGLGYLNAPGRNV